MRRVRRVGAAALIVVSIGVLLASCRTPVVQAACDGKLVASSPGTISDPKIVEPSGVVASAQNANTLWVLNDSGDTTKLYAISETGATRVTYTVGNASNVDWEDLALGRGPVAGRTYLYPGDIGDNAFNRAQIVVYRVAEPLVSGAAAQTLTGVDKLTFTYPDGAKDSEAFVVDPRTGEMYFFHKSLSGGPVRIYRAPANLAAASTTVLTKVGTLNLPTGSLAHAVTSADISPDGNSIAVRTYGALRLWSRDADQTFLAALAAAPCTGPVPAEVQGEAIGFRPDSRGYYTVGEATSSVIHRYVVAP